MRRGKGGKKGEGQACRAPRPASRDLRKKGGQKLILPSFLLSCCEKLAVVLRFAANRGALLLVVRACFDLMKQMLRETTREGKKRGSVSSSGAPAKRPHAKRALAENGDLRGHEDVDLHIRSAKKLVFFVEIRTWK